MSEGKKLSHGLLIEKSDIQFQLFAPVLYPARWKHLVATRTPGEVPARRAAIVGSGLQF